MSIAATFSNLFAQYLGFLVVSLQNQWQIFCFHTSKGEDRSLVKQRINASGIYKVYICILHHLSLKFCFFLRCLEGHLPKLQICHALEKRSILPLLSASLSSSALLVCLCVSEAAAAGTPRRPRRPRLLERLFQRNRMRFSWLKIMQLS